MKKYLHQKNNFKFQLMKKTVLIKHTDLILK
jgi:hypothetical protein